ncbi:hypothetical protein EU546_06170 [Candidatus Thorarchaeota archaeon]|nr:MAG: hypothetical protein EU546_06170 [Candidatus Thorarchaeota archaeon]
MENNALRRIIKMLELAYTEETVFPPTDLYNEGWMLRILLSLQSEGIDCLPFAFRPGTRWFSEALIASPFLTRFRGDPLAEGYTHLDGVVGHFEFRPETKAGLTLSADATQLVLLEAKMFSPLSRGITNATYYDQAARTMACMAWTIGQLGRSVDEFESLGFYVIAPQEQIARGVFDPQVEESSIKAKVGRRVSAYKEEDNYRELQAWYDTVFFPVMELTDINCISWEDAIDRVDHASVREFYERCRTFSASVSLQASSNLV